MDEIKKIYVQNEELKLEAEYFPSSKKNKTAVLICHPHPQFGGNMWNNVVSAVFNVLINDDVSCLRFNFRGVGRSSGDHGDGEEERSDVKACIDYLMEEKHHESIIICGYSYGAAIGCSVVNYSDNILGFIAISFPWDFMGSSFKERSQTDKPKLFIQGTRDTVANYHNFDKHYAYYEDPKGFELIQGADHFYGGFELKMARLVLDFCKDLIL